MTKLSFASILRPITNPFDVLATLPKNGGEGGIRTHVTISDNSVFKTDAFNRSATSPCARYHHPNTTQHQFKIRSQILIPHAKPARPLGGV